MKEGVDGMNLLLQDDYGTTRVVLENTQATICTCGKNGCPPHTGWAKVVREALGEQVTVCHVAGCPEWNKWSLAGLRCKHGETKYG